MFIEQAFNFANVDKDMVKGLTEKEVEIDHLKTTIISLS